MENRPLDVGDRTIPVLIDGPVDGELVILLHGFPQTPHSWDEVAPLLVEAGYRVAAPWQRGYTPELVGPRADYRADRLAGDVTAIADALGDERFHVVGHDWGAIVGWTVAAAEPERVRSLTALSVPHPGAFVAALPGMQAVRSLYAAFFQVPLVPELVLGANGAAPLRVALERSGLPRRYAEQYAGHLALGGLIGPALDWYRANAVGVLHAVEPVSVPTSLLWGRKDPAITLQAVEGTERFVTGPYRLVVIDDGHWLPERQPELVARHVLERIASADSVGAAR